MNAAAFLPDRKTLPALREAAAECRGCTLYRNALLLDSPLAPMVMATIHPSAILRAPAKESRREETELVVADLEVLARRMREAS